MTLLCAITRRIVVHRCPAVPAAEKTMPRVVRSRSALGLTIAALLPPSSSSDRPNRSATRGPTARPIRVEPVALSSATPGWSTRAWPTSAPPIRTCDRCGRGADLGDGPGEDGVAGQRRQRGQLGRLPHHRVAAHQGDGGVPRPDGGREVERADHAHDAQRVPGLHQPVAGTLGRHGAAVELPGQADREVADVDHLLDLAAGLGGDLADLEADQRGQVVLVLGEQLAEPLDQGSAGGRRDRAPLEEGAVGAVDGVVDRGGVGPRQRAEALAVDRGGGVDGPGRRVDVDAAGAGGLDRPGLELGAGGDGASWRSSAVPSVVRRC